MMNSETIRMPVDAIVQKNNPGSDLFQDEYSEALIKSLKGSFPPSPEDNYTIYGNCKGSADCCNAPTCRM